MLLLYDLFVRGLAALFLFAAVFNKKARLFVAGRRLFFTKIPTSLVANKAPLAWVHCASLGEFEQGRPLIEALKKTYPAVKIVLTFFSPSGYEIRKDYAFADYVFYLPWDTRHNATRFVEAVKPTLAVFVKYEFWRNYSMQLKKRSIPLLSISCILRPDQIYFKGYGSFFRKTLENFSCFFAQNEETKKLLASIGLLNCEVAGDTRFDRVAQIIGSTGEIEIAGRFKDNQKLLVAGSIWPEDLEVLALLINEGKLKFILAPHEISEGFLQDIERSLEVASIRYSQANSRLEDYSVLIIDNVGMLSKLYRYGEFAYVGGAYGKGLHNILEAACYGVPIFFGDKNYKKFQEATDLIMRGGAFEVGGYLELKSKYELLINRPENFLLACEVTRSYVQDRVGATQKIMDYCAPLFALT